MKRKIIKTLIIVLIFIMCILLISYFVLIKDVLKIENGDSPATDTTPMEIEKDIKEVTTRNTYYVIKNISKKYFEYIKEYNTDTYYSKLEGTITVTEEDKQAIYKTIYELFDSEYIKDNNISEKNIKQIIISYKGADDLEINKIYSKDVDNNTTMFWVDISLTNEHKKIDINKVIVGRLDRKNGSFGILPIEISKDQIQQNIIEVSTKEIEKNIYNKYDYEDINDAQAVKDFLTKYKNAALYNKEDAYNMLDDEYKKKKFENYNEFSNYIENNKKEIVSLAFSQYLVNEYNDYKEYVCRDEEGIIYIFREKAVMDITVILDTYTITLPQFTEKYDNANNNEKVAMNIDKIVQALNRKDSKYIYNKLDETFRKNNFPTLNDFENYINKNYASTYDLEYSTYSEENGTYAQNIILKDKMTNEQKETSIIMQLKNDYEFVMSFSIE